MLRRDRRARLVWKLNSAFMIVALVGIAVAGALIDRNVRREGIAQVRERLGYESTMLGQMTASALFGELEPSDTSLREEVHALGEAVHTHLALLAPNGSMVADSERVDVESAPSQREAPEIAAARAHGSGSSIRMEEGTEQLLVAQAIVRDGRILGYARSSISMKAATAHARDVRIRVALGALAALAVALLVGMLVSQTIVKPVRALAEGAERIGGGDFSKPITVRSRDELGDLADAFNDMTANLKAASEALDGKNRDMRIVFDHIEQGLMTVDRRGAISAEWSRILEEWFGAPNAGQMLWEYLARVDPRAASSLELDWRQLVDDVLPIELAMDQLLKRISDGKRTFELAYTRIPSADGELQKMLVSISDITAALSSARARREQEDILAAFEHMVRDRDGLEEFLLESEGTVRRLTGPRALEARERNRQLHTLKGNAATFGLTAIASLCHDLEDRIAETREDLSTTERARLASTWSGFADRLRALTQGRGQTFAVDEREHAAVVQALREGAPRLEVAARISAWKLERADDRLGRMASQARTLANRLGKPSLRVTIEGNGVRLPRHGLAPLWTALTHVVRNAVDHAIESPDERARLGKDEHGALHFRTVSLGDNQVLIEITDDGRGIDWDAIRARAGKDVDALNALFQDGVTTRHEATETSGRGLGLSAVKAACDALGVGISVKSTRGRGTTFTFRIPPAAKREARAAELN